MRPTKRSGHSSISVQKIWLMLLALVLIVAMMELSYTWLFTNTFSTSVSPGVVRFGGGDNDDIGGGGNLVQVQLRQGYSYRTSLVDGLRLNKAEVPQEADIIEDAGAGGDYKLEKNQSFASHGGRLNKTNTIRRGSNLSSSKRVAKTKAILTSIFLTTKSLTGGKTRDPKYHKEKKRNEMGQSKETEQAEFVGDSFKTVFERYQDEEIPMNQNWIVLDATSGNCIQHLSSGLPSGWKVMAVVQKPTTACK